MTLEKGSDPHLAIGETTVTGRDIEMLRAIDQYGSMHQAAHELGRSYPHLQRRVVELEDAIGQLTRRARGGKGGGGTQLTSDAVDLIQQFERLRVELTSVTSVAESVIPGSIIDQYGELATVRTAAGDITARVPSTATAETVEIAVRADAVVLMDPLSPSHDQTSLQNQLSGVVSGVVIVDALATVTVEIGDDVTIQAVVTEDSIDQLGIEEGAEVIAAFKTTAARAIVVDQ